MTDNLTTTTPDMHMERTFAAPRTLVFEAWTSPEHLLQWFGPHQYPVVSWRHDFRAGGSFEYVMQGPDGIEAPGSGEYLEIVPNEHITALSRVRDEHGHAIFEVRQTYTFADAAEPGQTIITIDAFVLRNENFPGLSGMEQGWSETLDRLGTYVTTR